MKKPTVRNAKLIYKLIEEAKSLEDEAFNNQIEKKSGLEDESRVHVSMLEVVEEVTHNKAFELLLKANSMMDAKCCLDVFKDPERYGHDRTNVLIEETKKRHISYSMKAICQPSTPRRFVTRILDTIGL